MIKKTLISALALVACIIGIQAQTQVIAHRGFWKTEGSAQNSIAALEKAAEENLYGSEFDVQVTLDGKLIVNHDAKFQGFVIAETPFKELKKIKLKNNYQFLTICSK